MIARPTREVGQASPARPPVLFNGLRANSTQVVEQIMLIVHATESFAERILSYWQQTSILIALLLFCHINSRLRSYCRRSRR